MKCEEIRISLVSKDVLTPTSNLIRSVETKEDRLIGKTAKRKRRAGVCPDFIGSVGVVLGDLHEQFAGCALIEQL